MASDPRRQGVFFVGAAAILWGLWPVWVRLGPDGATTATLGLLVAGLAGVPLALHSGRGRERRRLGAWLGLIALGVADAGNAFFYFRALSEGVVAPAVLTHYLTPVLVAAAAPLLLGEPRSRRTPLALLLTLGGTATMVLVGGAALTPATGGGVGAVGKALLYGALSALFYSSNVLISKRIGRWWSDAELMSYHALVSAALLVALLGGSVLPSVPRQWLWPAVGGLVSALLAGVLYYAGLRRLPAERAAILTYIEPLAAVLVGWVVLHEPPTWGTALGGPLILLGGVLVATAPAEAVEKRTV